MKRLLILLLIILAMTISFAAIGLLMLFATGTVNTMQDVRALLSGQTAEEQEMASTARAQARDALQLLKLQKRDLEREVETLKTSRSNLKKTRAALLEEIESLRAKDDTTDEERTQFRAQRKAKVAAAFSQMRPSDAAAILDQMSDGLVIEILLDLDDRQAASILTQLSDDKRKADLVTKILK